MLGGGVCEREVLPVEDLMTAARADVVLTEGLLLLPGVGGIGADFGNRCFRGLCGRGGLKVTIFSGMHL